MQHPEEKERLSCLGVLIGDKDDTEFVLPESVLMNGKGPVPLQQTRGTWINLRLPSSGRIKSLVLIQSTCLAKVRP